jgi:crotonobetainyl-CoA:carnitine CoA-transferase CaiB-like acyl-CoA transferase
MSMQGENSEGTVTALSGVKIADFTRQMAGPYASLMLGDFGADVVKIESFPAGDPTRKSGTHFMDDTSTMFLTWNRNKRSICLDMRTPKGLEIAHKIISQSDVVMENYRPNVAKNIGIGWEDVQLINPRAVYVSVNAFGSQGPWAERPGTDPVIQAFSGVMSVTGERDGGPVLVGIPIADYTSSMAAVQAVLLGLLARDRTGLGQRIEVPMFAALLFGLTTRIGPYFLTGENPQRFGSQHSQVAPYQAFETKDGWVVSGIWGTGETKWAKFCEALDAIDIHAEERFDSNVKRVQQRDVLIPLLAERFKQRTIEEWEPRFVDRGVLFTPVNSFSDIINHAQTKELGLVQTVMHPTIGELKQIGPAIQMSDTPGAITRPPPLLGQHTIEVLKEIGFDDEAIDQAIDEGTVKVTEDVLT